MEHFITTRSWGLTGQTSLPNLSPALISNLRCMTSWDLCLSRPLFSSCLHDEPDGDGKSEQLLVRPSAAAWASGLKQLETALSTIPTEHRVGHEWWNTCGVFLQGTRCWKRTWCWQDKKKIIKSISATVPQRWDKRSSAEQLRKLPWSYRWARHIVGVWMEK